VVGGGIAGSSLAYHLSGLGCGTVCLLEQNRLSAGTTWHAAGVVGRMRISAPLARLNDRSAAMYARIAGESGLPTGWVENGSFTIARTPDRMTQLRRAAAMANKFGVAVEEVGVAEITDRWPLASFDGVVGGVWLPNDGIVQPELLVRAIAAAARRRGAEIREGVRVTGVIRKNGRVAGVSTTRGRIAAPRVVLCTGMWTPQLSAAAGLPPAAIQSVEHHYVLSRPLDPALDVLPTVRDPDGSIFFRGREGRIMLGAFQRVSKPWLVHSVPDDFAFSLLEPDWDHFAPPLEEGLCRLPPLRSVGIETFVNGPEGFTPDGNPLVGELPGASGVYICAGFNSSGLAYGGGVGEALAQWIVDGEPPFDLWALDPRRFSPEHARPELLRARGVEVLGTHMRLAYPAMEWEQGRGIRCSPLYERLARRSAHFGEKFGFERPNWFATDGSALDGRPEYSYGRPRWFESSRAEHLATRESAAVFDQTSFGKIDVTGPDALALLQRACANEIEVEPGRVVYTPMLSRRGTFMSDVTVIRLADDRFRVITGTAQPLADLEWLRQRLQPSERVRLDDVTEEWAVLGVMGPRSRALLEQLAGADLSNDTIPFGSSLDVELADVPCRVLRMTYVGELGFELYVPWAQAGRLYDDLRGSAPQEELRDAGYYAINSLRLEKGYRQWGADLTLDDTPLEAGLGFTIAWDKEIPFHGRDALLRARDAGPPPRRLVSVLLEDPDPLLWGGERLFFGEDCVGYTTSGAYGHSLGAAVALGYVRVPGKDVTERLLESTEISIDVAGSRVPARASLRPFFDPDRERVLA
jgi:4-methylaminobutanoate oxidase (formaldehyde-forming)